MMQKIFHLDLNFMMLKKDLFRPLLKQIAEQGYNAVLWEVEDKIQWETCPECVSPEAFTKDEFAELLAFSRSLGLEPIPLLQTLGHAEYVLNHEEYESMRESGSHNCYCISHVSVLNLLQNWIQEYIDLFGDIHDFHLGGDEAWHFGTCPECSEKVARFGTLGFAMMHYAALADRLIRQGIRPNMWCDLMLQHPDELKPHLPLLKHFRIWDWQYANCWDSTFESTRNLMKSGLDVVLCSATRSWNDKVWIPGSFHLDNVSVTAARAVEFGLSAYCVTSWMIRLVALDLQNHLIAAASLSESVKNEDDRKKAYRASTGMDSNEEADDFLKAAELAAADFPLSAVHELGISWSGYKDRGMPPHGWLAEKIAEKYANGGIPEHDFDAAECMLMESQTIFERLAGKYPEKIAPWLEALSLERDHFTLCKMIAAHDPAGKEFLQRVKRKARVRFHEYLEERSAEEAVLILYAAISDFFSDSAAK